MVVDILDMIHRLIGMIITLQNIVEESDSHIIDNAEDD